MRGESLEPRQDSIEVFVISVQSIVHGHTLQNRSPKEGPLVRLEMNEILEVWIRYLRRLVNKFALFDIEFQPRDSPSIRIVSQSSLTDVGDPPTVTLSMKPTTSVLVSVDKIG